jgi:hypothetical protein
MTENNRFACKRGRTKKALVATTSDTTKHRTTRQKLALTEIRELAPMVVAERTLRTNQARTRDIAIASTQTMPVKEGGIRRRQLQQQATRQNLARRDKKPHLRKSAKKTNLDFD